MASSVSQDDLSDEFSMFGIEIDNEDALARFQELCLLHRLSAGDMVTEWVAFTQTKKNTSLAPDMLEQFERERLAKRNQKTPKAIKEPAPKVYTVDTLPMDVEAAEELYSAYGGSTPTTKPIVTNKRQHTPDNGPLKRFTGANRSPVAPFSPASFSPAGATPAKKYNSRNNRGDAVASLGSTNNIQWKGSAETVHVEHYNSKQALGKPYKYMFQKLIEKFRVLDNVIEDMAEKMQKFHNLEDLAHLGLPTQEDVTVVGRVCCDSQGKLNAKSVVLEGSVDLSAGKTIPVDLSHMKEYSLFPGQIVAMEGNNSTGQKFVAKKLFENTCLPLPDIKAGSNDGQQRLSVLIAAGPFSTSDSLSYEPLSDLVQNIKQSMPDVCILMGPFVDSKNMEIENGNLKETYDELFKRQMTIIAESTMSLGCKVLVLPSYRDIHHDCVYPQPPYQLENFHNKYQHMQFLPDPCTISINNVVFGLTSTDVLFHMGGEEISSPPGSGDRLGRLTQHLLMQHSYYPFYPPHPDVCIDYEQFQHFGGMPVTPHVLVVPSEFKQFIKDIKGCCCVNPGRLTKGLTGGTFARLVVQVNNMKPHQSLVSNITAQVVKI